MPYEEEAVNAQVDNGANEPVRYMDEYKELERQFKEAEEQGVFLDLILTLNRDGAELGRARRRRDRTGMKNNLRQMNATIKTINEKIEAFD